MYIIRQVIGERIGTSRSVQAFMFLRAQSKKNFPQGMSLKEINEEILP